MFNVVNITPGILPIPPNGWGATEKIIWEYHQNILKLGHESRIEYLDEIKYDPNTIVHIHVANLALIAKERGIPYYFTCHDHHSYLYGKNSICFKENYDAIKYSIKSFVPAKYLVDYFDLPNLEYLSHGVNTDVFKPFDNLITNHKLLCVANNGFLHDQTQDRKGFSFAIEAARILDLPITIAGPSNNKKFFEACNISYDKLNFLYDLSEEELIKVYQSHTIFLHPSILEAGHPNLTLLEAMSCGLPVLATFEENNTLPGLTKITRNVDDIIDKLKCVINNYGDLRNISLKTAKKKSWENITNILLNKYMSSISMKDQLLNIYNQTEISHKSPIEASNKLIVDFNDRCKVEILGDFKKEYLVTFKNKNTNSTVYETKIRNNMWAAANISYYVDWHIEITELDTNAKLIYENKFTDKRVRIVNESPSLGDYIAWMPCVDLFQKKHNCIVDFYTPNKSLFEKNYPNINFYNYNEVVDFNYIATYRIGCFDPQIKEKSPVDYRTQNLQQIAAGILGLEYKETKPILKAINTSRLMNEKYVCISTASTAGCKHWQNKDGWQKTVDYLNQLGYKVVVLQKELLNYMDLNGLNNVVHPKTNDIDDVLQWLHSCEFYIGLSSGVSWLAWALDKKVILISGFTKQFNEFHTPFRVINESVCNGCWNDTNHKFDRGDWNWCPKLKNTPRQFECTKQITFDDVKLKIQKVLNNTQTNFDEFTYKEIFEWNQYEQFVNVNNNDFVLDLGCSKGYFYIKHKDKNITYLGVDGSTDCLTDFIQNVENDLKPKLLHLLISDTKSVESFASMFHNNRLQKTLAVTFPDLLSIINRHIDFLKFDIEGYEKTFLDENYELFKSKVNKFSGEFHFTGDIFPREKGYSVLKKLMSDKDITIRLFSIDGIDITNYFWSNPDYYTEIIVSGYVIK